MEVGIAGPPFAVSNMPGVGPYVAVVAAGEKLDMAAVDLEQRANGLRFVCKRCTAAEAADCSRCCRCAPDCNDLGLLAWSTLPGLCLLGSELGGKGHDTVLEGTAG